jgi:glycosyltransferase involved in cell wall biosynthesis
MIDLSICIPTYNRIHYLESCLNSIKIASENSSLSIEVCISDNHSEEKVIPIIDKYKKKINLVFNQNQKNIGLGNNILKSASLASGEFAWIIGNDDIILPNSFNDLDLLIKKNQDVDFYYINSFHADEKILKEYPLDSRKIDLSILKKFSNYGKSEKLKFFQLIDPRKSFEFMLSMFLCIFRRKYWIQNLDIIDLKKISDPELYSNFDNTAPHTKIWSKAFNDKLAYFLSKPLTVNIHGPRDKDWGHLYAFVEAVRIPQVLDCYRKDGLSFFRYIICKNYALRRFIPSYFRMFRNPKKNGLEFVNIYNDIVKNLIYPSIYVAGIFFLIKKILIIIKNFLIKIYKYFFNEK